MTILKTGSKPLSFQLSAFSFQQKKLIADSCKLTATKGFTLIEVLMAVSLLAVGMVGVLRAYSTSVTAMEIAQYNIDAACLLKAVMGEVEEKSIAAGTAAGITEEAQRVPSDIKIDTTRSGRWQWDKEVLGTGFKVVKTTAAPGSDPKEKEDEDEETLYSLSEVKVTVVNPGRNPARRVSVVTYMESDSAES